MDIIVNGTIRSLTITTSQGVEYTQDLIGNANGFDADHDDGPAMTVASFDWWESYIATEIDLQARIDDLMLTDINQDELEQLLNDASSSDYIEMQSNIADVLDTY